jgi:hypothetical protein
MGFSKTYCVLAVGGREDAEEVGNSGSKCTKEYVNCEGTEAEKDNRNGEEIEICENERRLMTSRRKLIQCQMFIIFFMFLITMNLIHEITFFWQKCLLAWGDFTFGVIFPLG